MGSGRLRDRVAFQSEQNVADDAGGNVTTWATQFIVWGGFRPERGAERLQAGRLQDSVTGILRVRSSSDTRTVTTEWRALIDNVPYQIRSITNPDRRDRYLEMTLERGVAT